MNRKEFEQELRLKYYSNKGKLKDPFDLLDLVADVRSIKEDDKKWAIELAEEIYFGYGGRNDYIYDQYKDR